MQHNLRHTVVRCLGVAIAVVACCLFPSRADAGCGDYEDESDGKSKSFHRMLMQRGLDSQGNATGNRNHGPNCSSREPQSPIVPIPVQISLAPDLKALPLEFPIIDGTESRRLMSLLNQSHRVGYPSAIFHPPRD